MNSLKNIRTKIFKYWNKTNVDKKLRHTSLNKSSKPSGRCDMIGPVDKISNLRLYKYYIPEDEAKCEYDYRRLRQEVFEYNNQYWTQQNLKFIEAKKKFLENLKMEQKYLNYNNKSSSLDANEPELNSKQMNEFYKIFLNENYYSHYEYNKTWFKYNLSLIIPAIRVYFYRLKNRRFILNKSKN